MSVSKEHLVRSPFAGFIVKTQRTNSVPNWLYRNIKTPHNEINTVINVYLQQSGKWIAVLPNITGKILTKLQFQNFAWTSTSNSWPNLVLKVWTKFSFMTKLQLPNLHTTVVKTFLIINISNSNNLNKFWVGIFTSHTSHQSSLLNRSEWVSEWVSQSVSEWQA